MTNPHQLLRDFKSNNIRFNQKEKPIFVFGLRRGGSTMLADAIAACRGVWFSNEPYAIIPKHSKYEIKRKYLREVRDSHYFNLTGDIQSEFKNYTDLLLNASIRELGTTRKTKFFLRSDRIMLKILNAPWMIEWFSKNYESELITIIRHPAAQSLSVIRQGWGFPVKAYAERATELEEFFSPYQLDFIRSAAFGPDRWMTAIIDWIIISFPLRILGGSGVIRVKYEDIVVNLEYFVQKILIERLGLKNKKAMLDTFGTPSGSSRMSEDHINSAIRERAKEKLVHGWIRSVDKDMALRAQRALDLFEVSEYNFKY